MAARRSAEASRLWDLVAGLECQRCGRHGVQVAHSNQQRDGKGMGIKAYYWKVAALCPQCHTEIDQGRHLSKEQRREEWQEAHRRTFDALWSAGVIGVLTKG